MSAFPPHFASSACAPCYSPYPSRPLTQPCRPGKSAFGDMSCEEHQLLKVALLHRLKEPHRLRNKPAAFPFHCLHGHVPSVNSFEFHEELPIPPQDPASRPRSRVATIAFTHPEEDKSTRGYLTWRIYFPLVDSTRLRTVTPTHQAGRIAVATVQVEPLLVQDPWFGRSLCQDPTVIIRALAMSLELGKLITIQYKYKCDPRMAMHGPGNRTANPVVYMGTGNDGRQEPLLNIEP